MFGAADFFINGRIGNIKKVGGSLKIDIASPIPYKDKETGKWNENIHWNTVTAFDALADRIEKSHEDGDLVNVKGRLKNDDFERDGEKVYTVSLIVSEFNMLAKAADKE